MADNPDAKEAPMAKTLIEGMNMLTTRMAEYYDTNVVAVHSMMISTIMSQWSQLDRQATTDYFKAVADHNVDPGKKDDPRMPKEAQDAISRLMDALKEHNDKLDGA